MPYGVTKTNKVVLSFSASVLCDGCIYKDNVLGVPQGESTPKKVEKTNVNNKSFSKISKNVETRPRLDLFSALGNQIELIFV